MKKVALLLFVTIFITSCFTEKDDITDKVWNIDKMSSSTETKEINVEENLDSNNKEMSNIQTEGLKENDIVAVMKTTNGIIKIKMFTQLTPITTTNFLALASDWYYDGIIFHRIIKWFMIQWGDPEWTGRGWKSIYGESFEDEFHPELKNIPYSLSMANAWPNTNGSQFFINEVDNSFLNNKHSVFGQVVDWFDNVDKIAKTKTWENDKPEKEVKIISINIQQFNWWSFKDIEYNKTEALKNIENMTAEKQEAKKTKAVEKGDSIEVHYTGTLENWEKFDSSHDRWQTLPFTVWAWQMIPWFDAAVVWMKIWDKKSVTLEAKDAYWEAEVSVPEAAFESFKESWIELKAWAELPTAQWVIKIIDVKDWFVIIENNHELAGKVLNFDIELVNIK
jgi:cyclophilin family peptidyl-prolyl cis-trans isomerase/FKBP-type peptidyl-prolyl cis-trans isomerase 2